MSWGTDETTNERQTIKYAFLAQLVEHLTLNQGVQGSNPWRRTKNTVFADNAIAAGTVFLCFTESEKIFYATDTAWRTQGQAGKHLHAGEKTAVQDADKLSL